MQEATIEEGTVVAEKRMEYFPTIINLIRAPRAFFSELGDMDWRTPAKICCISAVFHVAVGFTYIFGRSVPLALVLFCNAMLMPLITASLAHIFLTMFMRQRASLSRVYAVFALASAPALLFSWVPAVAFVTEPWRLLLIGFGLNKACGLGWKRAAFLVAITFVTLLLLVWSALPLISDLRQLLVMGERL